MNNGAKSLENRGLLATLVALRLSQIESAFETRDAFDKKAQLAKGTLYSLRQGRGNPTVETLEILANNLGMSVWSLLAIKPKAAEKSIEAHGLNFREISEHIQTMKIANKPIETFKGAPRGTAGRRRKADKASSEKQD